MNIRSRILIAIILSMPLSCGADKLLEKDGSDHKKVSTITPPHSETKVDPTDQTMVCGRIIQIIGRGVDKSSFTCSVDENVVQVSSRQHDKAFAFTDSLDLSEVTPKNAAVVLDDLFIQYKGREKSTITSFSAQCDLVLAKYAAAATSLKRKTAPIPFKKAIDEAFNHANWCLVASSNNDVADECTFTFQDAVKSLLEDAGK